MPNPVFVNCTKDVWTKVATNVFSGNVWKVANKPNLYLSTYKLTGVAAPVGRELGVPIFRSVEPDYEEIGSLEAIDVYIFPVGEAGRVRVDL